MRRVSLMRKSSSLSSSVSRFFSSIKSYSSFNCSSSGVMVRLTSLAHHDPERRRQEGGKSNGSCGLKAAAPSGAAVSTTDRPPAATPKLPPAAPAATAARELATPFIFRAGVGDRLAGQVNAPLGVDLKDFDLNFIPFFADLLRLLDKMIGELVHTDEAFLAREDLDKNADTHDAGDFPLVDFAHFRFRREAFDFLFGTLHGDGINRRDIDGPVVFHFDFGACGLNDAANVFAAGTDQSSDLIHRDLYHD